MFSLLCHSWVFLKLPCQLQDSLHFKHLTIVVVMVTLLIHYRLLQVVNAGTFLRDALQNGSMSRGAPRLMRLNGLRDEGTTHHLKFEVIESLSLWRFTEARCSRAILIYWVVVAACPCMDVHVEVACPVVVVLILVVWPAVWVVILLLLFVLESAFTPIKSLMLIKMTSQAKIINRCHKYASDATVPRGGHWK